MKITDKERFIELRAKGLSLVTISKELKKTRQTLASWNNELQEEIANAKGIELEALYEQHFLSKEHKIKNFSKLLTKISEELDKRDFESVSTEKLIDIKIKLTEQLKAEYIEPEIKSEDQLKKEKSSREFHNDLTF
jgi:hypothetical protein